MNLADPPVLRPGVMLRRDWHVQLDFAPKAGQPERLWVRVESVNGNTALADWSKARVPLACRCRATCCPTCVCHAEGSFRGGSGY